MFSKEWGTCAADETNETDIMTLNHTPCSGKSKRHRALRVVLIACLFVSSTPVFGQSTDPETAPPPTERLFKAGQQLYQKQCLVCHGATGQGDGPAAYLLHPRPRDFTREEFRLISTEEMVATDRDLFTAITRGMPGSSMPSWEGLTDEQRWALVYYVRYLEEIGEQLEEGKLTEAEVATGLPWETTKTLITTHADVVSMNVPSEPAVTHRALEEGETIYAQACMACHGALGKGDGPKLMQYDSEGFPVKPRDLTAGIFKGSGASRDLYYRIMAGLPGSPMPSYAGAYSDEQVWSLIHYVQSLVPKEVTERAGAHPMTVKAARIEGELPAVSDAQAWRTIPSTHVAVSPLWWRDERIPGLDLQAVHNGQALAIRLAWDDATESAGASRNEDFPDGVAVQLSAAENPPFFGMGGAHEEVNIWHWKASWQRDLTHHEDVEDVYPAMMVEYYRNQKNWELATHQENTERQTVHHDPKLLTGWGVGNPFSDPQKTTAAEDLRAQRQGTLTSRSGAPQVQGQSAWHNGQWSVVFSRSLETGQDGDIILRPGASVSFAVAVWDGAAQDRNGQKAVSIWRQLELK